MRYMNLLGQTFTLLTVIGDAGRHADGGHLWRVRCECGGEKTVRGSCLRNKNTRSCGCLMRGQPKPRTAEEPAVVPGARWIPLTRGKFALVDEADHAALSRFVWYCADNGYARGWADQRRVISLHTLLLPGAPQVDHINGDRLDNRRSNLRAATCGEQSRNTTTKRKNNTSGFKGVSLTRYGRWYAQIRVNGRVRSLGLFGDPKAAARAYDAAAKLLHGDFARINEVT